MDPENLRAVPVFAEMSEPDLKRIATFATEDSVPAGATLMREGDFSNEMIAIESGTAEVTRDGQTLSELGPGDVFGEIGVLERAQRTASVTATSPMRLITLTGWDMARVEKAMPEAIEQLHQVIEERRPG
jgi:CRP-like cAMP-binding protein